MSYLVKNGINIGSDNLRFEPGDVLDEETLVSRTTKKARKWLLDRGHIEPEEAEDDEPAGEEE